VSCTWVDNPEASPDLIPDSEPGSYASSSHGETSDGEEDLDLVPSTVHVGTPDSPEQNIEPTARPSRSLGGT